jgi:hypothetical protein
MLEPCKPSPARDRQSEQIRISLRLHLGEGPKGGELLDEAAVRRLGVSGLSGLDSTGRVLRFPIRFMLLASKRPRLTAR